MTAAPAETYQSHHPMSARNITALVLILVSFGVLVPGLTKPLLTITASVEIFGFGGEIFRETKSILQSIKTLHENGYDFVAGLILVFSVIVPFVKGLLLIVAIVMKDVKTRFNIYLFVRNISKWSMADVFVVGVFVAFLSAQASSNLAAIIESGFYFFAAYCLISLAALQFLKFETPEGKS